MRAHSRVLAAALRADAEYRLEIIFAVTQRVGGDDQMIERRVRRAHQPGTRSLAGKSSSTLAPLGSKKKTCQSPVPACCRHSYATLRAFSADKVATRSLPLNAMWSITPGLSSLFGRPPMTCNIGSPPAYSHAPGKLKFGRGPGSRPRKSP